MDHYGHNLWGPWSEACIKLEVPSSPLYWTWKANYPRPDVVWELESSKEDASPSSASRHPPRETCRLPECVPSGTLFSQMGGSQGGGAMRLCSGSGMLPSPTFPCCGRGKKEASNATDITDTLKWIKDPFPLHLTFPVLAALLEPVSGEITKLWNWLWNRCNLMAQTIILCFCPSQQKIIEPLSYWIVIDAHNCFYFQSVLH